jgi:hypothetical protein
VLGLLILGTSIVLAGQSLSGRPGDRPGASVNPAATGQSVVMPVPAAPTLVVPEQTLVAARATDIGVAIPASVPRDAHRLRLYINGEVTHERRLPPRDSFTFKSVSLVRGQNVIRAAIVGPAGESLHSAPVMITRDDVAPMLRVAEPAPDAHLHADQTVVRGRTEAGAEVTLTNAATAEEATVVGGNDGRFEATITLAPGSNELTLVARDAVGNRRRVKLAIIREDGAAAVRLTVSRELIELAELPASVSLSASITDASGAPADGADVTFSMSAPGQSTITFPTTSNAGVAVWHGVRLPREGARTGQGFATVLVTLPSGQSLQGSATFSVR